MAKYLDPKVDLTFKRIFGDHPELLINFLNSVMPFAPDRLIVSVEGYSIETIAQFTDLSTDQVAKILKEKEN